jgi:hypothetical protein
VGEILDVSIPDGAENARMNEKGILSTNGHEASRTNKNTFICGYHSSMARLVYDALTLLSLLLCIAATALWVRSHFIADQLSKTGSAGYELIDSDHGVIAYVVAHESSPLDPPSPWRRHSVHGTFGGGFDTNLGSSISNWTVHTVSVRAHSWWISHWMVVIATAAAPLLRLPRVCNRTRARRHQKGLCLACGYDLRASPSICPECGAAVTAQ